MIKSTTKQLSVKQIRKMKLEGLLRFDLAIQRKEVWTDEQKSLLIHSLLYGYPVPSTYAIDHGDKMLWFLDGKQRISTIDAFLHEGFKLSDNTPSIEIEGFDEPIEIKGHFMSQLPTEIQSLLESATITVVQMKNITDSERDELFLRLNNGAPLKPIELTRVHAGSNIMEFVHEVSEHPLLSDIAAINDSARKRFADEEIVFQIMALMQNNGEAVGISGKEMRDYAINLRQIGLSDELKEELRQTLDYLNDAFPVRSADMPIKDRILKKIHLPMLFVIAWKNAIPSKITAQKFGGWAQSFFQNQREGSRYNQACSSGSAKRENVSKRIESMTYDYVKNIDEAIDYKIPEPKIARGGRTATSTATAVENEEKAYAESQAQAQEQKQNDAMWDEPLVVNEATEVFSEELEASQEQSEEVSGETVPA